MTWRGLTDRQWEEVRKHLPPRKANLKGGRPWADDRNCFEGILWILWTGAQWSELPPRYGKKSTVHLRLHRWTKDGTLEKLWRAFLAQLSERGQVRWDECFLDGTFFSAKKGGSKSAKPSAGRDRSLWFWLMARVLRSDFTWTRRPRRKSSSRKSPSRRSGSAVSVQVVPALVPNA
jgi:transposase